MKPVEWFNRGWTLRELLAPRRMEFDNEHWKLIRTKNLLIFDIAHIGKIGIILSHESWIAERGTTRKEDIVYSMLGLFGVVMVPIYAEGQQRTFPRVPKKLLFTRDESLLAWKMSVGDQH